MAPFMQSGNIWLTTVVDVAVYLAVVEPVGNEVAHLYREIAGADILTVSAAVGSAGV